MTQIEPEFPAMTAVDTVVREAQALVQRYRLLRRLEDDHGVRKDLRGADPEPELVAEMVRQLVPGVDAPLASRRLTWPIPAGVRLETLHASPWLAEVAGPMGLYTVPTTAEAFAAQFQAKTGIEPESEAMDRNYRITPLELGRIAMTVRGQAERPSLASLLLSSHHFDAAVAEEQRAAEHARRKPLLDRRYGRLQFRGPTIRGFKLLTDLQREALIIQDLARFNSMSVITIRELLDSDDVGPLRQALAEDPQLKRLFDYMMIGADALGGFDNADRDGYIPTNPDLRVTAAARGVLDVDVVTALTREGELARATLRAAFTDRNPSVRENILRNHDPATFYGLNWTLAGAMQFDLGRQFQHGDDGMNASDAVHERQALLARTIVGHCDPTVRETERRKVANLATYAPDKTPSGTSKQRDAQAHALFMMPAPGILGAGARADADMWGDRYRDAPLWWALLNRRLGNLPLGLDIAERARIDSAFYRLTELFERTFAAGCGAQDTLGRSDAVHAACDLATAVSAISMDRQVGQALRAWIGIFDARAPQPADKKDHGVRWWRGMARVLHIRRMPGVPSAGVGRKGTPRSERRATRKLKALYASRADGGEGPLNTSTTNCGKQTEGEKI